MEIINDKYRETLPTEECPYCHSTFKMDSSDYKYSSNCGELAGVGDGWAKYYDCPCCHRRVILESKSWEDENTESKFPWGYILVLVGLALFSVICCIFSK